MLRHTRPSAPAAHRLTATTLCSLEQQQLLLVRLLLLLSQRPKLLQRLLQMLGHLLVE